MFILPISPLLQSHKPLRIQSSADSLTFLLKNTQSLPPLYSPSFYCRHSFELIASTISSSNLQYLSWVRNEGCLLLFLQNHILQNQQIIIKLGPYSHSDPLPALLAQLRLSNHSFLHLFLYSNMISKTVFQE